MTALLTALIKLAINEAKEVGYDVSIRNSYHMFTPNNFYMFNPFLFGPYSPKYRKDRILNIK